VFYMDVIVGSLISLGVPRGSDRPKNQLKILSDQRVALPHL
jgi:hypothetical protein